jgi:hypothetical protein
MARCIARILIGLVPWMSFWVLIILIAAKIILGPIGWIALAVALGTSIGLLVWAIRKCQG